MGKGDHHVFLRDEVLQAQAPVDVQNLGATLVWASNLNRLSNLLDPGAGAVVWGTAGLGYRIQPRNTGFHFRIGGGALFGKGLPMGLDFSSGSKRGLLPWIYIGAGASF